MTQSDKGASPTERGSIHIGPADEPHVPRMSEVRDVAARLKFSPETGRIWLDDHRMLLIHSAAFASMRRELVDSLGAQEARGMFTRMGYAAGARDAALAAKIRCNTNLGDIFSVGPELHALEGFVAVEPVRIDIDVERGIHYVEQIWHDSAEDAAHMSVYGVGAESACWMQIGYASGFNSAFFGRPILFREVQCRAAGDPYCRIIGKPLEEWEDTAADLRVFQPEDFMNVALQGAANKLQGVDAGAASAAGDLVGASSAFMSACHKLRQVAGTNATVLLLGETGVGKEKFATMLHRISKRADKPFIALNCAALPESLLEAELFGVERGAYTGASEARKGRFERADGGTLFLDEIGTLNEASQTKLLRALQEREIERVGGSVVRSVDVRVVAATNADLEKAVRDGRFRADLYYRLNVFPIHIPPLRERRDDIALLLHHFVKKFSLEHGKRISGFTHRAMAALLSYDFPGNVRELENLVERGLIVVPDAAPIDRSHLFQTELGPAESLFALDASGSVRWADQALAAPQASIAEVNDIIGRALDASMSLDVLEAAALKEAVRRANGNLSLAARLLGITRAQLAYRLDKHKG